MNSFSPQSETRPSNGPSSSTVADLEVPGGLKKIIAKAGRPATWIGGAWASASAATTVATVSLVLAFVLAIGLVQLYERAPVDPEQIRSLIERLSATTPSSPALDTLVHALAKTPAPNQRQWRAIEQKVLNAAGSFLLNHSESR